MISHGGIMNKIIFLHGIVLMIIAGILMAISTIQRTSDVTVQEYIAERHVGALPDNWHDEKIRIYLVPGTYGLYYSFRLAETTITYNLSVLDPDGVPAKQVFETLMTERQDFLIFDTVKTSSQQARPYYFHVKGQFFNMVLHLYRLKQETITVYPYEASFAIGLPFFIGACATIIAGSFFKKRTQKSNVRSVETSAHFH